MKTVGIIAEFNPFHNGHEYIIETARRTSGADFCVVVMSGDFVQRGEPAVCDKYARTRMALNCGADAVFEIPAVYCCGSAEQFATGSVGLLASLGCIDELYFGSESSDLAIMNGIAGIFVDEPEGYRCALSAALKEGLSFPAARQSALKEYLSVDAEYNDSLLAFIDNGGLASPNNILGIEYCKSIIRLTRRGIVCPLPRTVKRTGSRYDSESPDTEVHASATAIRKIMLEGTPDAPERIRPYVPAPVYDIVSREYGHSMPVCADDFSSVLYSKLQNIKYSFNMTQSVSSPEALKIPGIPDDLSNSILNNSDDPISFSGLCEAIKTKNHTYTSISRALLSVLLDTGMVNTPAPEEAFPYARLLGFRRESSELLRNINSHSGCEIINKLADAVTGSPLLQCDIRAARLYSQVVYQKFGTRLPDEYRKTVEII